MAKVTQQNRMCHPIWRPANTDPTRTTMPSHALSQNQATFYTPGFFSARWMPATAGQNWGPPKPVHSLFLLVDCDCFGAQEHSWKILFSSSRG